MKCSVCGRDIALDEPHYALTEAVPEKNEPIYICTECASTTTVYDLEMNSLISAIEPNVISTSYSLVE